MNIWDQGDATYWNKLGGYPVNEIVKYLTEDSADIILLQEVTLDAGTKNQAYAKIKQQLEEKGYQYSAFYLPDYSKGVGIVGYIQGMENSGYPLVVFSKFPVSETFAMQRMNKKTMHKGVLGIKIKFNKKALFVFNTHLGIGSPHTEEAVSKVALPFINSVAGKNAVIVGGDWNCQPALDYPKAKLKKGKYTFNSKTDKHILDNDFNDAYRIVNKKNNLLIDATYPDN